MAKVHDFLRIRDLNCSKETTFSLKLKFSAFWGPFRDTNLQFAMYIYLFTVYIYITHTQIYIHTHSLLVHSWFTEGFHHFLPSEKLRKVKKVIVIPIKPLIVIPMAPWHLFAGESGGSFSSPRQLLSSGHGQDVAASLWRVEAGSRWKGWRTHWFHDFHGNYMGIMWEWKIWKIWAIYTVYIYNIHTCINYICMYIYIYIIV